MHAFRHSLKGSWDIFPHQRGILYLLEGPKRTKAVTEILSLIMTEAVLDAGNRTVNISHQVLVLTELAF